MNPVLRMRQWALLMLGTVMLSACIEIGGGGGGFVAVEEGPFTISGRLTIAAGITVDSDINDAFTTLTPNNSPASAQAISNNALVHGFASQVGTGGSPAEEHFHSAPDVDDYYQVALQAGQVIRMQVVDFSTANDLDLYLLNSAGTDELVASQNTGNVGEFEEITVPADGDYLINVHAFSGISKYVLQILPANSGGANAVVDFVPGEIIVQYQPAPGIASRSALAGTGPQLITLNAAVNAASAAEPDPLQAFNPVVYEKRRTLIAAKRIAAEEGVLWAEPNYIVQSTRIPNDLRYAQQWHYPAINLPQAWDITIGDAATEVIVAVIDTGVYLDHPDLAGQLMGGYDFIRSTSASRDGDSIDNNPDDPGDSDIRGASSWHGTHVAGTVAAASNNTTGVAGVSWGAKIMPLRALGKGGGTTYDVAQSIRYAARLTNDSNSLPPRRADIINLSLGSSQATNTEQAAINAARAAGVIIVAAAGNENRSTPFYPAAYNGVIAVSATKPDGNKASYSNFGNYIDIAAPGGEMQLGVSFGVLSTVADDSTGTRRPAYAFQQGTSMAAPHVAGVIALMKAVHPGLTETEVRALITSCAITHRTSACSRDNHLGYGRIDAYKAVVEAQKLASAGGVIPALPAIIRSSLTQLEFGTSTLPLDFVLTNVGDNDVSSLTVTVSAGSSWLSVAEQSVGDDKLGTYRASVNRTGLVNGRYNGAITVTYQDAEAPGVNKSLQIMVSMQVGASVTASAMTQQYVLLENADCTSGNCIIRTVLAHTNGTYAFTNVPRGNYRVYAGSDIDVDGFICGAGETCGSFPSLGAEQIINLTGNRSGVNFLINLNSGLGTTTTAAGVLLQRPTTADHGLQKSR